MAVTATNLGRVGVLPKGEYDPRSSYVRLDIVRHNGSGYIALKPVSDTEPGTDPQSWMLLVEKGDIGPIGFTGPTGPKGERGNGIVSVEFTEDYSLKITDNDGHEYTSASLVGPQGEQGNVGPEGKQGEQGEEGVGITNIELQDDFTLKITLSDGSSYTTGSIRGEKGEVGPAYTIKGDAYDSVETLQQAVQAPDVGDQYNVGTEAPYNVYRWTGSEWEDQGKIQGPIGPSGKAPRVGEDGTWETYDNDSGEWSSTGVPAYATKLKATIPAEGWSGEGIKSVDVTLEGINPSNGNVADIVQNGDEESDARIRDAWTCVTRIVAQKGKITVYATEEPEVEIPIEIIVLTGSPSQLETISSDVFMIRRGSVGGSSATPIGNAVVELDQSSWTYDGSEHTPKVQSVKLNGLPLTEWEDYVYVSTPASSAGSYNVLVMGVMEYGGACNVPWTIEKAAGSVSVEPQQLELTGKVGTKMTATVSHTGDGELSIDNANQEFCKATLEGDEVSVESIDNGQATITITLSDGENYTGASCTLHVNVTLKTAHIWGVTWDGQPGTKWTRTDDAKDYTDPVPYYTGISAKTSSPFDEFDPWKSMTVSEDPDCGKVVTIKKFWYELKTPDTGGLSIRISDEETEGFVVDPAHMNRGASEPEVETVLVGRYHCADGTHKSETGKDQWCSVTHSNCRAGIQALGDHVYMMDHATWLTIQLLYLVEYADWESQGKIGFGRSATGSKDKNGKTDDLPYHTGTTANKYDEYGFTQYRNIEGLWDNVLDWLDGCYYSTDGMYIILDPSKFDDTKNGTFIGKPSSGYPSKFAVSEAGGYPMFYPTEANGTNETYSCDYWYFGGSGPCLCVGGGYGQYRDCGLSYVSCNATSSSGGGIGGRLLKRVPSGGV